MTNNTNISDMLAIMCDATLLIADDNWGDVNVAKYVRSQIPDCQHVEVFEDILYPVITRRKKATRINEESADKIDAVYKLFQERDKKGLCDMQDQLHTELQVINNNIFDLTLNAKAAEILEKSDEYNRLQKEISANHSSKQDLEKLDTLIVKLSNLF